MNNISLYTTGHLRLLQKTILVPCKLLVWFGNDLPFLMIADNG